MAKVNVSLPDDMLTDVDALALQLHRSRCGLVQEATAQYLTATRERLEREERARTVSAAAAGMRELAARIPVGRDCAESIRDDRDNDYGNSSAHE